MLVSAWESTRRAVSAAGAYHGVRVASASTVDEGVALWRSAGAVDPVVLDVDGDPAPWGEQLADAVGGAAPRILAVRPQELASARRLTVEGQFAAVVTKPVTLRRVHQALSELTDGHQPAAAIDANPLRVLVVDDDLISRKIAQSLISRLGHEVDVATDGTSALESAGRHAYDVYVIDLHMPDMMGTELARTLRGRHGEGPYLLALTAAAMPEDRERCLDAGMHGFLAKPVDVVSLREAFERIAQHAIAKP